MSNKPKQQQNKPVQVPFRGYIRCEIARAEVTDFRQWAEGQDDSAIFGQLLKLADSGYRIGFGAKGDDMMASLSNQDGPEATRGYVLTSFGRDAQTACLGLLYKHYVKLAADWGDGSSEDDFHVR